jgi:hypothetical protein
MVTHGSWYSARDRNGTNTLESAADEVRSSNEDDPDDSDYNALPVHFTMTGTAPCGRYNQPLLHYHHSREDTHYNQLCYISSVAQLVIMRIFTKGDSHPRRSNLCGLPI